MTIGEAITSMAGSANRMLTIIRAHTRLLDDQGQRIASLEERVETLGHEVGVLQAQMRIVREKLGDLRLDEGFYR